MSTAEVPRTWAERVQALPGAADGKAPGSAQVFSCNLDAVDATVERLGRVLTELGEFTKRTGEYEGTLASSKISNALHDFDKNSSEQRDKLKGSVEALHAMLKGLADGVRQVDTALAGSLPDIRREGPDVLPPEIVEAVRLAATAVKQP